MLKTVWKWIWRSMLLLVVLVLLYQLWIFGHILYWTRYNPDSSSFMDLRLSALHEKSPEAKLKFQWVDYNRISTHLKRAIIAAEDGKFVDHEGFDWEGIQTAIEKNQKKGKIVAGGSTITQQLAKNLFLSGQKSWIRKGEETVITVMLEKTMDKERIFEIYLNMVEWGNGVFGAEAASRYYYAIPASTLSPEQAAKLAAMLPNPRFYDRNRNAPGLMKKTGIILGKMNSVELP